MAYTTQSDLDDAAGGAVRFVELADLDGDGTVDAAMVARAQAAADGFVDAHLRKFSVADLARLRATPTATIKRLAADETILRIRGFRRGISDDDRTEQKLRSDELKEMRADKLRPDDQKTPRAAFFDNEDDVSREKLKGGLVITAEFDMTDVDRSIAAAVRAGGSLGSVFRALRPEMRADQRDHAKKAEGPEGNWPPRAASTIARLKAGAKGRARRPLGKLLTAVDYRASSTGVSGTSKVKWSGSHFEGDKVGRGAELPVRQWLWIGDALIERAWTLLQRHILKDWGWGM